MRKSEAVERAGSAGGWLAPHQHRPLVRPPDWPARWAAERLERETPACVGPVSPGTGSGLAELWAGRPDGREARNLYAAADQAGGRQGVPARARRASAPGDP